LQKVYYICSGEKRIASQIIRNKIFPQPHEKPLTKIPYFVKFLSWENVRTKKRHLPLKTPFNPTHTPPISVAAKKESPEKSSTSITSVAAKKESPEKS
jgi:hypothetical protein